MVEATGNAASVAAVIAPHVKRVVVANPKQVRIIAHAKIKTDTIDASVLAQLYASGFLPEVWIPDEPTQALRRQVTRRNQIVRQRSRLKNIIQSILHSHLIPSCPHADLCGASGALSAIANLGTDARVFPPRDCSGGYISRDRREAVFSFVKAQAEGSLRVAF